MDTCPLGNFIPPMTTDLVWRDPGGSWACLWPGSNYKWNHLSRGCDTDIYVCGIFEKQVVFLMVNHFTDDNRYSVERPWGILSLFTTWFRLWVNSPFQRLWHRHIYVCGIFEKQVVFLTVNHRGPLPFRELHSTDDNRYSASVERPWGILSLFTTCSDYEWIHLSRGCRWHRHIYVCGTFVKQVVFLPVNHRGPLPFRELHSTDDNRSSVERPWGILSLFTTCSDYKWIHLSRGCDTDIHMYVASLWSRSFFLWWITVDPSPLGNFTPPMKQ